MARKTKLERRYLRIQKIIRKRNYGFQKEIDKYTNKIYSSIYSESVFDRIIRETFKQYSPATESVSKESLADLYGDLNQRNERISSFLPKFFQRLLKQGSGKVFDATGTNLNLKIPSYKQEIKILSQNNLRHIKDLTDRQRELIQNEVSKGIKEGKTYTEVGKSINKKVSKVSQKRAQLIAKNESHLAHRQAMEKTMVENGFGQYQWVTAGDNRVSPICKSLHRQIFKFNQAGTMQWRAEDGEIHTISKSPKPIDDSHIGCRCIIIAVD